MNCNNCDELTSGKYCANCGQKVTVSRLTLTELFHDGWHAITHTDKGIFKVLKDAISQPINFYRNYFGGQRKKYFSPVLFFALSAGLVSFLYLYVFRYQDKVFNTNNEFGKLAFHETKFRAVLMLPIQIFLSWIAFRKRFNIAEITVFWLFAWGMTYCFRIISIPLYFPLIKYKLILDSSLFYISYMIIFWQGIAMFGRNATAIVAMFIIVNFSMILDLVVVLILLFGFDLFDNPVGIHSWWDIITSAYAV